MVAKTKKRGGRPPKGSEATSGRLTIRLTDDDRALLERLRRREQAAVAHLGIQLSAADALRLALRREASRQG